MKWFGENWGAPVCAPEDKVETPAGESCLLCNEPVLEKDQGVVMPFCDVVDGNMVSRLVAEHLDCFLDSILPHGPDCRRCRGLERGNHSPDCAYRTGEGDAECSCDKGKSMEKLLDPALTLAEAQRIADHLQVKLDYLLELVRRRRTRRGAHANRRSEASGV